MQGTSMERKLNQILEQMKEIGEIETIAWCQIQNMTQQTGLMIDFASISCQSKFDINFQSMSMTAQFVLKL